MATVFIKPGLTAEGEFLHILYPNVTPARVLPVEGAEVELCNYWQRRLNDGDVVEAQAIPPPKVVSTVKQADPK